MIFHHSIFKNIALKVHKISTDRIVNITLVGHLSPANNKDKHIKRQSNFVFLYVFSIFMR